MKKVGYVNTCNFQHNTKPIFILPLVHAIVPQTDFYIADEPFFPIFSPCGSSLCKLCCVAPTGGLLNHKKIPNKKRSCKLQSRPTSLQSRFLPNTCIREPIFTDILQGCADFQKNFYKIQPIFIKFIFTFESI